MAKKHRQPYWKVRKEMDKELTRLRELTALIERQAIDMRNYKVWH